MSLEADNARLREAVAMAAERLRDAAAVARKERSFLNANFLEITGHRMNYVLSGGVFGADFAVVMAHVSRTQGSDK